MAMTRILRERTLAMALAMLFPLSAAGQAAMPDIPALMRQIPFSINEVLIEGNTLVPTEDLSDAVSGFLGNRRKIDDLEAIRLTILEAYRVRGHELLSVMYIPSRSTAGRHVFVVLEVELGKVSVTGASKITESSVRTQLPALREGALPDLNALARQLALFNENPGRSAVVEYSPGERAGVADAIIQVTEAAQSRFALTLNNSGTAETGRSRSGFSWSHYNAFQAGHQATFGINTSPEELAKVRGVNLDYRIPLPAFGDVLAVGASASKVKVGQVADVFNIAGSSTSWNLRYLRKLTRTPVQQSLEAGYDERHYRDIIDFQGTNLGTPVTARPLSLTYRLQHNWLNGTAGLGITWQRNLPGDGRSGDAAYAANRSGADANWSTLQLEATWKQVLPADWSWMARLAGQYTREPLISAEQFGLGGAGAVRGFAEREGAGDRGLRLSGELYTPTIAEAHQFLLFVDGGRSSRLEVLPGESSGERLISYGLGWRATMGNTVQIMLDAARVAEGTLRYPDGSTRVHASAALLF